MPCFIKVFLPLLAVMITAAAPGFAYTLDEVRDNLNKAAYLQADFKQKRELKEFNTTLTSEGTMILSIDEGIVWLQEKPFYLKMVITQEYLKQTGPDGREEMLSSGDNAVFFEISSILRSLFSADFAVIERSFAAEFANKEAFWILTLTPKISPLDKIFDAIVLQGTEFIDNVKLADSRGDVTSIDFANQSRLEALNDAQKKLFAP